MVKLFIGHKGSGKTKKMLELANEEANNSKGSIIFIYKDTKVIYQLSYKIRTICMEDFIHITNEDEYIGFIFGILSSDNDIETIYIDGILRHTDFDLSNVPSFINKLKDISRDYEINFVASISAELEELTGVNFDGIELLN